MVDGSQLIPQVNINSKKRIFEIMDDGLLVAGTYQIYLSARATDSSAKSFATLYLEVKESSESSTSQMFGDLASGYTKLAPAFISVAPLMQVSYESNAFAAYTNEKYTLLKRDRTLSFITMDN